MRPRLAAIDRLAIQMHVAALLRGEIDAAAIRRPLRRALAIVDRGEFVAV